MCYTVVLTAPIVNVFILFYLFGLMRNTGIHLSRLITLLRGLQIPVRGWFITLVCFLCSCKCNENYLPSSVKQNHTSRINNKKRCSLSGYGLYATIYYADFVIDLCFLALANTLSDSMYSCFFYSFVLPSRERSEDWNQPDYSLLGLC